MKIQFLLVAFLTGLAASCNCQAEKADSAMPTIIDADGPYFYDHAKQINTISGNVSVNRGTLRLKAGKVTIKEDPAGNQFVTLLAAPNDAATFRQKTDGGDLWVEGEAERIEYDSKQEIVKFFSKAKFRRLEGTRPAGEMAGEFISYDSRSDFLTLNNTSSGESKPGAGRIKIVIPPRPDSTVK